jgi:hypothetical protein
MLILGTIKPLIDDWQMMSRMVFVKDCRLKPDQRLAIQDGTRKMRTQTHWSMYLAWATMCVYMVTFLPNDKPDSEVLWLIITNWLLLIIGIVCLVVYMREFAVRERWKHLATSLLVWQVALIVISHGLVSMMFPEAGDEQQVIPGHLCSTFAFCTAV